jgi:NAD-dependent SIR2 family protein deacetylase
MNPLMKTKIQKILRKADVVVVLAGAGFSADSGLPTFRGDDGMWRKYPALGKHRIRFTEIAHQQAFLDNPELAWAFYGHRYNLYQETRPHDGYRHLLDFVQQKHDYFVVTSNVDRHFHKAGFDTDNIYEVHGRIHKVQCVACGELWELPEDMHFNIDDDRFRIDAENIPRCTCGGATRPNIMLFNDAGFDNTETRQQATAFNKFMNRYDAGAHDIAIIEFGAGTRIPTIRLMSENIQKHVARATLIRVNPEEPQGPTGTISIGQGALQAIQQYMI